MRTIGFNEVGRRQRAEVNADRLTRAEAVARVDAMLAARDAPGARIYKPLKPPPATFVPRVTRAAERDAAEYNAMIRGPERVWYGGMQERRGDR